MSTPPIQAAAERYEIALRAFLSGEAGNSLDEAYDIGRQAVETGLGVIDMAAIHQRVLSALLKEANPDPSSAELVARAAAFATESFAIFEAVHRGYQEANEALTRLTATLEQRVEARTGELRESEVRYRALVDGLDAIVWESDLGRRRFSFVNHRVETMLGYPVVTFAEEPDFWETHVYPADFERMLERGGRASVALQERVLEYRFKAADGRWVWLRDVVRVLRDAEGKPARLSGFMIDVSEVVAVQQYRDNLVDVISHEFRTPLTVIQGYTELLTDAKGKLKPDAERTAKQRIRTASAHLAYLLGSITELSRLRSGGPPPRLEPLPVQALVQEAVTALSSRGRDLSQIVKIMVGPKADHMPGERRKMTIALVELLDNAAKFSPPSEPIFVEGRTDGEEVFLTVEDRGPGIAEGLRENLFRPFVQADMTAVRPTGGAGLGLAVASGLVKAQGGHMELDSVVGEGSAFHIVMPATAPKPAPAAAGGPRGASLL